jgi:predicted SAM-dependent methyltransferase
MLDAGKRWKCASDYRDGIRTEHTLERLDCRAAIAALREAHRTVKAGDWLQIVLPGVSESLNDRPCRYKVDAIGHSRPCRAPKPP